MIQILIIAACAAPNLVETPLTKSIPDTQVIPTKPLATQTGSASPTSTLLPSATPTDLEATHQTYEIGKEIWGVAVADLNSNGLLDIAASDRGSGVVKILLNLGDGNFEETAELATGEANSVAAADLDGDSNLDLAVANGKSMTISILIGLGDGTFQEPVEYAAGTEPFWIITEDINQDAHQDLVVPHFQGDIGIYLNNGDGSFQEIQWNSIGAEGHGAQASTGDLNGDTFPDLAVRHYPDPYVSVLLNDGTGSFHPAVVYDVLWGPHWVAIADLNHDTSLDLAVPSQRGAMSVLLNNGDGSFQDRVDYEIGGDPHFTTAIDLNEDKFLDLLVDTTGTGTLSILTNDGEGAFEVTKDYYFPNVLIHFFVLSDVNGDQKSEVVGSSLGSSVYILPIE